MPMKILYRLLATMALLPWVAGTHAATLTMNGWLFGSGHTVDVSAPSYRGLAGGFKGALSGLTDTRFNNALVEMYCVDLAESLDTSPGRTYSVKMDGEPGTAVFTLMPASALFSAAVVDRLARLVSLVEGTPTWVDTSQESTSMQLAIWNTIYDTDLSLTGGTFKDASSHAAYANSLLAASVGTPVTQDLYVLRSVGQPGKQDQLIWIQRVPEPATWVLVALALGGAAGARRWRPQG